MKPITKENVLESLRVVKNPDLHRDIVSLNFIKDLSVAKMAISVLR